METHDAPNPPPADVLHTMWGLDPVQLHARYWASLGVQVVRVGEPSSVVEHAELYLLLDPRSLPLFRLGGRVLEVLEWVEPTVLNLRLRDARERGYREYVLTEEDEPPRPHLDRLNGRHGANGNGRLNGSPGPHGPAASSGGEARPPAADRFARYRRVYDSADERLARVALTTDAEIAALWEQARDPLNGWRRIRRFVPREERATLKLQASVYDRADDREVALLVRQLVGEWRRPHATIARAAPVGEAAPRRRRGQAPPAGRVWADPTARVGAARFVGNAWVGAGRRVPDGRTLVGPTVLWDDPARRPGGQEVGEVAWLSLEPDADDFDALAPEAPDSPRAADRDRPAPRPRHEDWPKRLFDLAFSVLALLGTAPLWPVILLGIWWEDGRPFFFGHERQSLGGRAFKCWKFRSMRNNAEEMKARLIAEGRNEADGAQFFMADDPRITRIGRFLRKTNLDELPQFWNVIRGDMSVVGPRPSPDRENQFHPRWREARLSVRPGITGLWQVRRTRAEGADFQEWIKYDIEYVETRSFWGDLRLIWKTGAMIARKLTRA